MSKARNSLTFREAAKIFGSARVEEARLTPKAVRISGARPTSDPEYVLGHWLQERWPDGLESEYVFSDRHKYRFDYAWPEIRLAVEVDGWQFHGKHKAGFERDRVKDRLAMLAGWRVPRFTAKEIMQEMPMVMATLAALRVLCEDTQGLLNPTKNPVHSPQSP